MPKYYLSEKISSETSSQPANLLLIFCKIHVAFLKLLTFMVTFIGDFDSNVDIFITVANLKRLVCEIFFLYGVKLPASIFLKYSLKFV